MNSIVEKKLSRFMFPVEERKVYVEDFLKGKLNRTSEYKAIFREDKNKLIAITKKTYKLVPNSEVIMPLMDELDKLTTKWIIDPSHTFVSDSKMRLQVSFPDITVSDGKSDIALSLFLHNSYDQTSAYGPILAASEVYAQMDWSLARSWPGSSTGIRKASG